MTTMTEDGDRTCPICAEEMDLTDLQLKPCKCGYDICVWCWHQILGRAEKDGSEGRCPACRTIYDKEKIIATDNSKRILPEEKRQKSQRTKNKSLSTIDDRKQLTNVRVVQKNLVYVMGMPSDLADEKILEGKEYFGQYGKVLKVSISRQPGTIPQHASVNDTFNVYISYAREDEAVRCIQSVHNFVLEDRPLRACFGTTKYCYIWLRNMVCNNPDCLYLHEIGSQEESFTKDEIISAYTRSRVPPIPSNCLQPRAGDVLPPPIDDFHNGITLTMNPPIKNSNNNNINQMKSLPVDANSTRSTVLPAAASWGSRTSNCHPSSLSVANLQNPTKQKIEIPNGTSNSLMPKHNSVCREDKSTINESIKNNNGSNSNCELQHLEHNVTSAWEDDTPSESISDRNQKVYACGVSKNISPISGTHGEVSLEESRCSERDNAMFLNLNMNRETKNVNNDENIRPVETANKDSVACESISSSVAENKVNLHLDSDNRRETNLIELPPEKSTYINYQLAENFGRRNYSGNEIRCSTSLPESGTPTIHEAHVLAPSVSCEHLMTSHNGEAVDKLFSVDGDCSIRWENIDGDPSYFTGISESNINCTKDELLSSNFDNSSFINRNSNVIREEEKSIVSKVLSSDFDPWDNSWSKLLAEMNINHEATSKQSNSLKAQDANQSRFSFARQDNFEPTVGYGQEIVFPKHTPTAFFHPRFFRPFLLELNLQKRTHQLSKSHSNPSSFLVINSTMATSFSSSISTTRPLFFSRPSAHRPRGRTLTVHAKIREIFMPALSSTMTEGKIVSWIKSEGDKLSKGESVVVVESDKADMDVETFYDGILAAIVVPEGDTAPVGSPIGLLAESEEEVAQAKAQAASSSSKKEAVIEPPSNAQEAMPVNPAPGIQAPPAAVATPSVSSGKKVASPYAKKLAKQHKVDVMSLVGTGPYGRVTAADVEKAAGIEPKKVAVSAPAAEAVKKPAPASKVAAELPPIPGATIVPFTTMQSAVSKNMVESLNVPSFRVGYPIMTDALDALYERVKSKGVTMTVLLAKAAAMALAQHPVVNASCKDGKSFTYNSNINIAVAVAIDGGLITPVLQDADKLDIYLLSQKWKELVSKARSKQLSPNEYNSGTFTLSNLGMFGVDRFDAILPPGQGAIMAVGASKPTPVAGKDGFFSVKNKMLVNVTADHRIVYGADLAAFLQTFSKIIENPDSLTL